VAPSVKSLEWVKPVIQIRQVIDEVTSLRSSQASAVNLKGDDSDGLGDIDPEKQAFKIPHVRMADSRQRSFLQTIGLTGKDIEDLRLETE
jgi:hypothetical protein